MAIILCPECGGSVSDKAPNCIKCGYPLQNESKVIIYGYTQWFLINPKVEVIVNGQLAGDIGNYGTLEIPINESSLIEFKCGFRKNEIRVEAGKITEIKITWNRVTGSLEPVITNKVGY